MKKFVLSAMAVSGICLAGESSARLIAYRDGRDLLVRSHFSAMQDVVIKVFYSESSGMPNELAYLVPKSAPLLDYTQFKAMHRGGDEIPAYPMPMYGTLGGNHGSPYGRKLKIRGHGLTVADLGARLTAEGKGDFYIIRIIDQDQILIHPENRGKPGFPIFTALRPGDKLLRDGVELAYADLAMQQVYPGNRYRENAYLVNGGDPLPDKTEVPCDFLDHVVDYDIIMPDARVDLFQSKPGIAHDFIAPELPGLLNVRSVYRYQDNGACVVAVKNTVLHDMAGYNCLGVMLCWSGEIAQKKKTEFYIPKLKPLRAAGKETAPDLACDFSAIYTMPDAMPVSYHIAKSDCLDPEDPPDRFIRLAGDQGREIGVALGYSLFDGVTAKSRKTADRGSIYYLYHTKKMYPFCLEMKNCRQGDEREVLAYRQYFDPQREPDATAFYFHRQRNSDVVYLDFHKSLNEKRIALPDYMAGKQIAVLERTPSVTLHTKGIVPADGVSLSVAGDYGYIVLKLD